MHRIEKDPNIGGLFGETPPNRTPVGADWLNATQEEIANVIEQTGIALKTADTETRDQLWAALQTGAMLSSILTTQGDLIVKGASLPERLAAVALGQVLKSAGVGTEPVWGQAGDVTTQGDLIVRGAAIPERLAAVAVGQVLKSAGVGAKPAWGIPGLSSARIKIGSGTRDAAGAETVSGVEFQPVLVFFLGGDTAGGETNISVGFDNGTEHSCVYIYDDGASAATTNGSSININRAGANQLSGEITTLNADGFIITWTLVGAVSLSYQYLTIG